MIYTRSLKCKMHKLMFSKGFIWVCTKLRWSSGMPTVEGIALGFERGLLSQWWYRRKAEVPDAHKEWCFQRDLSEVRVIFFCVDVFYDWLVLPAMSFGRQGRTCWAASEHVVQKQCRKHWHSVVWKTFTVEHFSLLALGAGGCLRFGRNQVAALVLMGEGWGWTLGEFAFPPWRC